MIEVKLISDKNGLFYIWDVLVNLMVTRKQKPRTDTQKIKKGETEKTSIDNHQLIKIDKNKQKQRERKQ